MDRLTDSINLKDLDTLAKSNPLPQLTPVQATRLDGILELLEQLGRYYRMEMDPVRLGLDAKVLMKYPVESVRTAIEEYIADPDKPWNGYPQCDEVVRRIRAMDSEGDVPLWQGIKPTRCEACSDSGWVVQKWKPTDKEPSAKRCEQCRRTA